MHGKTTTSAMAAHVLRGGGLHPSHYVGAEIPILGQNAHWDPRGEYFVAEGDESDGTLQLFQPEHALILNIEEEHLDFYADLAAIEEVFAKLLDQTQRHGFLLRGRSARAANLRRARPVDFLWLQRAGAIIAATDLELQDFAVRLLCVSRRRETRRRHPERARPAQRQQRPRRDRARHRAGNSLRENREIARHVSATRAGASRSNTRAIAFCSSTITRIIRPRSAPRSRPRKSAGRKRVLTMFQPHRYSRTKALRREFGARIRRRRSRRVTDVYRRERSRLAGHQRTDDRRRDLRARTSRASPINRGSIGCTAIVGQHARSRAISSSASAPAISTSNWRCSPPSWSSRKG